MSKMDFVALSAILLSACASQIPEQTRTQPPPDDRSVADSRDGAKRFNGEYVRWGGTIAAIENRASRTWIEVDRCHLSNNGTPGARHREGRFLAIIKSKLDPAIYARGRRLTVVGDLKDGNSVTAEPHDYAHPMVNVTTHHLWASSSNGTDGLGARPRTPKGYTPWFFGVFY